MTRSNNMEYDDGLSGSFTVAAYLLLRFTASAINICMTAGLHRTAQQSLQHKRYHICRLVIFVAAGFGLTSSALSLTGNEQTRIHTYMSDLGEPVGLTPMDSTLSAKDIQVLSLNTNGLAEFEGCDTQVSWPGGQSGPTIGCGIDLGTIGADNIDTVFRGLVPASEIRLMQRACGIKGTAAKLWVERHHIVITKDVAQRAFYRTCMLFWDYALVDYPGLEKLDNNTQGVVLSLVFNYGPHARQLDGLRAPIKAHNICGILEHVRKLQAGVSMPGLVRRRKLECSLLEIVVQNKVPKPPRKQDYFD